jgi:signal transduction histidine kinase
MLLPEFILQNMEAIIMEWESFAGTLYPGSAQMTSLALRDHSHEILSAVVADLSTGQTVHEQAEKSKGRAPKLIDAPMTAAEAHAVLRARSGLNINQLTAEYRALRASVLRLWIEAWEPGAESLQEVIRFNEAIDQALAESISLFSVQMNRARDLLLGTLGHDMRSPLNAMVLTAADLADMNAGEEVSEAAERLIRSGASMTALLDDMLDFSRTNLGVGINIEVAETNLMTLLSEELKQHCAANPHTRVDSTMEGDLNGQWDGRRLQQVLRNLLSNANAYGSVDKPVRLTVRGDEVGVQIEVANHGAAIDSTVAAHLFDPLRRGATEESRAKKDGLGLGLFIVREITRAHGGDVAVRSDADATVFSVRLPRRSKASGIRPEPELQP